MTSNIEPKILKACSQALKCKDMKEKHGCVIWDKTGTLSVGYNKGGMMHKLQKYGYRYSIHAEADALMKLFCTTKGAHLLVVRFKNNKIMNSNPCAKCRWLMKFHMIKNVYYSDSEGNICREVL